MNCSFLSWNNSTNEYGNYVSRMINFFKDKSDLVIIKYNSVYAANERSGKYYWFRISHIIGEINSFNDSSIIYSKEGIRTLKDLFKRYRDDLSNECIDKLKGTKYEL